MKFKIGDKVKAHYEHGNGGSEFTKESPLIGVIDSIGTHYNASKNSPYHVTGNVGCWGEDELELVITRNLKDWDSHLVALMRILPGDAFGIEYAEMILEYVSDQLDKGGFGY